ncbi:MAG: GNAT family N-acetyltransferase [Armatimonadetes bacterium]|nr:GNAT family N-acetyltransferase [Armatimonadota bacterium]
MIFVRSLVEIKEFEACVALQKHTWGENFSDLLPVSVFIVLRRIGGIIVGAFQDQALVGFCVSYPGWEGDERVQWSDMAAVRADLRGQGVGFQLKQRQREIAREQECARIVWTYDPLESRNAWFNLARLGARVRSYEKCFYGELDGPLVGGVDSDRLIVDWDVRCTGPEAPEYHGEPIALSSAETPDGPSPRMPVFDLDAPRLWLEIPLDFQSVKAHDLRLAAIWRRHLREAMLHYLGRGWRVDGFCRVSLDDRERGMYRLAGVAEAALNKAGEPGSPA